MEIRRKSNKPYLDPSWDTIYNALVLQGRACNPSLYSSNKNLLQWLLPIYTQVFHVKAMEFKWIRRRSEPKTVTLIEIDILFMVMHKFNTKNVYIFSSLMEYVKRTSIVIVRKKFSTFYGNKFFVCPRTRNKQKNLRFKI